MFENREQAGHQLAVRLEHLGADPGRGIVVLGLPRGGVVVAAAIARDLKAPLDVLVVRKLGAPAQPELAIGAVTDGERPQQILNERLVARLRIEPSYLRDEIARQLDEVRRRQMLYRRGRPAIPLAGRAVVVVDDGIATGATVRAGVRALRQRDVASIVLAVPVAPAEAARSLAGSVDELVCLETPASFTAVGEFYRDFRQTTDDEVIRLLAA